MECVKIGDIIIVTKVLSPGMADCILHKTLKIVGIDTILPHYYPYCVYYNCRRYWVEGVLYSSLVKELL